MLRHSRFALLLGLLYLAHGVAVAAEPVVGKPHPKLCLPTIEKSQTIDLRSLRGQKVLLIQFASW